MLCDTVGCKRGASASAVFLLVILRSGGHFALVFYHCRCHDERCDVCGEFSTNPLHHGARYCSPLLQELLSESPDRHIVVSAIAPRLGHIEDSLQAAGFMVFSISPHARTLAANPLVVPEANADVLLSTLAAREAGDPFPLVKSPNCVTCGISVVLKAIDDAFGLDSVAVTTFQALSGRGDAKYEPHLVVGNVYPLTGTAEKTDDYQRAELQRIFPALRRCTVAAHRVPVQVGVRTTVPWWALRSAAACVQWCGVHMDAPHCGRPCVRVRTCF